MCVGGGSDFLKNIINAFRKISRLYPLHIIMFITAFIFLYLTNRLDYYHIGLKGLSNLFLFQSCIPLSDYYYSFNGVSWYLSLTFFLYIIFPYIRGKIKKHSPLLSSFFLYLCMIGYCLVISIIKAPSDLKKWFVYINPLFRSLDFAIGCCAGSFVKKYRINKKTADVSGLLFILFSIASVSIFALLKTNEDYIAFVYSLIYVPGVFMGLISLSCDCSFLSKALSLKDITRLGDISGYAFLIHQMAIWYVGLMVSKFNCMKYIGAGIKVMVAFIVTILGAIIYELAVKCYSKNKLSKINKYR